MSVHVSQSSPSWCGISGEIRNRIYEWCLAKEENGKKIPIVSHCPCRSSHCSDPRPSNFPSSFWGLTQVNKQIRAGFKPWLLKVRRVRTPLATLNTYADIFHPVDKDSGTRTGWIEPIQPYSSIPLPICGIDIINILKHNYFDPDFHLELPARYFYLLRQLGENIIWEGALTQACNFEKILLVPTYRRYGSVQPSVSSPSTHHETTLQLQSGDSYTHDGQRRTAEQQLRCIAHWLFHEAQLMCYHDLSLLVKLPTYKTMGTAYLPGYYYAKWEEFGDERGRVDRVRWLVQTVQKLASGQKVSTIMERKYFALSYK